MFTMRTLVLIVVVLMCIPPSYYGQSGSAPNRNRNQGTSNQGNQGTTDILTELMYQISRLNSSLQATNSKISELADIQSTVAGLRNNYGLLKDSVRKHGMVLQEVQELVTQINSTVHQDINLLKIELYNQRVNQEKLMERLEKSATTSTATSPAIPKLAGGVPAPPTEDEDEFRVVCYFINWGSDRKQEGIHLPEDLDVNLCTHVNYAYASLDSNKLLLKEGNAWVDIDNRFYERVTSRKLKNPRLKVLLSLGGWSDSAGDKYSRLVRNATARKLFKDHAITFLRGHNFDGLNIQWQYPSCWQFDCDNSPREDRQNFVQWIQELKEAFDRQRPRLMLTVSVSPNSWVVSHAYDVPALARAVDYINVMSYDYHGDWDSKTGHPAPLYYSDGTNEEVPLNVNASMHYWAKRGAAAKKLVMEIQTYGRTFTLSDPRQNGMNAPVRSGGRAGEISDEKGKLAYYEICQRIKTQGWTKKTDPLAGTYAYKGDQWVGYDDLSSIAKKARYVKENKFGGVGIWDTSMDDFKPMCCRVANPLLNVVSSIVRGHGLEAKDLGCE